MTSNIGDISHRKAAMIAGIGLLLMTLFYLFADVFIFKTLIIPGNASATVSNIMASESLFRSGVFCILMVLICDVVVAWALYVLLKPVNNSLSLLAAWFRLVYSVLLGVALVKFVDVLLLVSGADYLSIIGTDQLNAQILITLDAFYYTWFLGLIIFGLHLVTLGFLVFKSDYISSILGILLLLAGISYLVEYISKLLVPDFNLPVSMILGWGELIFMLWLLWKGARGFNKVI